LEYFNVGTVDYGLGWNERGGGEEMMKAGEAEVSGYV